MDGPWSLPHIMVWLDLLFCSLRDFRNSSIFIGVQVKNPVRPKGKSPKAGPVEVGLEKGKLSHTKRKSQAL